MTPEILEALRAGTVESVEYTYGGAGNQWTTIDGVRYATWWNIMTKDWKIGDKVSFRADRSALWHGSAPIPCASNIRKVEEAEDDD